MVVHKERLATDTKVVLVVERLVRLVVEKSGACGGRSVEELRAR